MMETMQGDEMLTRKIELIMEMNAKKVISEVTQLRSELENVKALLANVQRQATQRVQEAPQMQQETPTQESQPQVTTVMAAKPTPERPIDRNKVAPSSVSIDKIFYYGNK